MESKEWHTHTHIHALRKTDDICDMWVAEQYSKSCELLDETLTTDKFC